MPNRFGYKDDTLPDYNPIIDPLWKQLIERINKLRESEDKFLVRTKSGVPVGCFVIRDNIASGWEMAKKVPIHRRSKMMWAEAVCNGPLQVIGGNGSGRWNPYQAEEMEWIDANRVETEYLGQSPIPLFYPQFVVKYHPFSIFLYPENWLVPKQEREFVLKAVEREEIEYLVVITKSPLMIGEFVAEQILILTNDN